MCNCELVPWWDMKGDFKMCELCVQKDEAMFLCERIKSPAIAIIEVWWSEGIG